MHESFQAAGNVPEVRDVLKIVATGYAIVEQQHVCTAHLSPLASFG
jgi:hypothetical protein